MIEVLRGTRGSCFRLGLAALAVFPATVRAQDSLRVTVLGHIIVPARVDGVSAWLLLDPIRGVVLDRDWARTRGLQLLNGEEAGYGRRVFAGGAGAERHEAHFAHNVTVRIGSVESQRTRTVLPLDSTMATSIGHRVAGFVGVDFFAGRVIELSAERRYMRLWDTKSFVPPLDAVAVPVTFDEGIRPIITLRIALPAGEQLFLRTYLDLGMAGPLRLTTRLVNERGLIGALCAAGAEAAIADDERGLGGGLTSVRTRLPALAIDGVAELSQVVATLARETEGADAAPRWDALAGWELLRRFDVWMDPSGHRLWMRTNDALREPFPSAHAGVTFGVSDGPGDALTVAAVDRGSPSATGGVMPGDAVVALNGQPVGAVDAAVVERQLGLAGASTRLTLQRGGRTVMATVTPRETLARGGACRAR